MDAAREVVGSILKFLGGLLLFALWVVAEIGFAINFPSGGGVYLEWWKLGLGLVAAPALMVIAPIATIVQKGNWSLLILGVAGLGLGVVGSVLNEDE